MSAYIPVTVSVRLPVTQPTLNSVLDTLEQPLKPTAHRVFSVLFEVGLKALQSRGQTLTASQVVIHQPVEVLALHLGISRVTFYKHLADLQRLGLVASRGHTSSYANLSRKDGTLFAVALKPGHRARLRYEDLKHKWRDLNADIASGTRTAWAFLQGLQSKSFKDRKVTQEHLVAWAVNPGQFDKNPVTSDCKGTTQEYVYSLEMLSDTHPKDRKSMVDTYAHALAAGFLDGHNINFWRKLLWQALRCEWQDIPALYQLQNALTRLQADRDEWQGLRSPAALLITRLKSLGLWDALKAAG